MRFGAGKVTFASVVLLALFGGLLWWNSAGGTLAPPGEPIMIYCAAGVRLPVSEVAQEYKEEFGYTIETQYAGSGTLLSSMRASGSGDLYLAADETYTTEARKFGLIDEVLPIASQKVVIVVAKGNPKSIQTLDDLKRENVKLSLADPERTAIGRVAKKLIEQAHPETFDELFKKAANTPDTVNQVANDIKLNAADAGFVWSPTVAQYEELEQVELDVFDAAPKKIEISVLKNSKQATQALHFARYLTARERGLKAFAKHKYDVVEGDQWVERPEIVVFAGGLNRLAIEEAIEEFGKREGVTVNTTYNGCGTLVGQMKTGAVPDMYFSCDVSFMTQVEDLFEASYVVSNTDMVLITPKDNPGKVNTLEDLANPGLKVGFCHPQKSALGALTKGLLEKRDGLYKKVYDADNVKDESGTADVLVMRVVSGGMDAAIVYYANAKTQLDKLNVIEIDDPTANAIQPIAVSSGSEHPYLAGRLMDKIRAISQEQFKEKGFRKLGESKSE